jgi:hypothetical protein
MALRERLKGLKGLKGHKRQKRQKGQGKYTKRDRGIYKRDRGNIQKGQADF